MTTQNKQMIALLGGRFDPIHLGHLHVAKAVHRLLGANETRLIPCHDPPHRDKPKAAAEDRIKMARLAASTEPGIYVDDREIQRAGISYTIDTLKSLRQELPDTALALIMSADTFSEFTRWHEWKEILTYAHIVIVNRPSSQLPTQGELKNFLKEHETKQSEELRETPAGKILILDIPASDISATKIRQQIQNGKNPSQSLPKTVWDYITTHKLYSNL